MARTPTRRFGDYDQVATLRSGGMGEVLLARKVGAMGFTRLAAVKTIRDDRRSDESARRMFRDEARIAARLHHPAIGQVYDFGASDDVLYYVMEYVAGVSLDALTATASEPVSPEHVARIGATAARGLHAAHTLEVVHRDVSPQNVMLTYDGAVKVIDFGIARARDRGGSTEVGTMKGKPAYMAPEQIDARGMVDRRTDLWALGVVLWELATGRRLFAGTDNRAVARDVLTHRIQPLSSFKADAPPGLVAVVERCLARNPNMRPETALEVAEALEEVAAGSEVLETFAARALAEARRKHDEWLAELLAGSVVEVKGRAVGVATMGASRDGSSATQARTQVSRRTPWAALGVALALVVGGVALMWMMRERPVDGRALIADERLPISDNRAPIAEERLPTSDNRTPIADNRTRPRPAKRQPSVTPPSAKVDAAPGYLRAIAEPYALVRVNGTIVGPTPLMRYEVPSGSVLVELLEPDSGAVRLKKTVHVHAGELATVGAVP
ncbi:MAG TPA: serine/threonine-protein kinase [Myxococcota bacterium]|nr:serine/threonine-protein kinase [Myxococcota bacterium]